MILLHLQKINSLTIKNYIRWLTQEIDHRHFYFKNQVLRSIYFGGGTPSILPPSQIVFLIQHLKKYFSFHPNIEISIEINPGTLSQDSLQEYLEGGINRFSLGVQTFRDDLLKKFNRGHSAQDTFQALKLLKKKNLIFSTDIMFALNKQSRKDVKNDIQTLLSYHPQHISTYCLTLPKRHILQKQRPKEEIQIKMFHDIKNQLEDAGFEQYEISNFAKNKQYSKHNLAYWRNQNYWGLGLSAHSFLKKDSLRVRFWNPKNLNTYAHQVQEQSKPFPFSKLPKVQKEILSPLEALTDFCHTSLRTKWGFTEEKLSSLFKEKEVLLAHQKLLSIHQKGLIRKQKNRWFLPFFFLVNQ